MNRHLVRLASAAVATMIVGSALAGTAAAHRHDRSNFVDLLRAAIATARFHSLDQAGRAGYALPPAPAPLHECISNGAEGAMGFHYINGNLLDTTLRPTEPEALVYAPDRHGKLHLAALEFVVFQDAWNAANPGTMPELFGQMFMPVNAVTPDGLTVFKIPPFYMLHVWLWNFNPSGLFNPWNPRVSCAGANASASAGATTAVARLAAAGVSYDCTVAMRRSSAA